MTLNTWKAGLALYSDATTLRPSGIQNGPQPFHSKKIEARFRTHVMEVFDGKCQTIPKPREPNTSRSVDRKQELIRFVPQVRSIIEFPILMKICGNRDEYKAWFYGIMKFIHSCLVSDCELFWMCSPIALASMGGTAFPIWVYFNLLTYPQLNPRSSSALWFAFPKNMLVSNVCRRAHSRTEKTRLSVMA